MDINKSFLEAIKKHLSGERVDWSYPVEEAEWLQLFKLAAVHNVVPMVYEAVFLCPSYGVYIEVIEVISILSFIRTYFQRILKPMVSSMKFLKLPWIMQLLKV